MSSRCIACGLERSTTASSGGPAATVASTSSATRAPRQRRHGAAFASSPARAALHRSASADRSERVLAAQSRLDGEAVRDGNVARSARLSRRPCRAGDRARHWPEDQSTPQWGSSRHPMARFRRCNAPRPSVRGRDRARPSGASGDAFGDVELREKDIGAIGVHIGVWTADVRRRAGDTGLTRFTESSSRGQKSASMGSANMS